MALPTRDRWIFRRAADAFALTVRVLPRIRASNGVALRELAVAGLGPTMLADWLVDRDIAVGRVVDLFPGYTVTVKTRR